VLHIYIYIYTHIYIHIYIYIYIYIYDISCLRVNDLIAASEDIGVAVNAEEAKQMVTSCDKQAGQNHNITNVHKSSERVEQVTYLGTTLTNQNSIHEENQSTLQ